MEKITSDNSRYSGSKSELVKNENFKGDDIICVYLL